MRVNTLGNVGYVVTSAVACIVTADVNGTTVTLASIGASGGQAYFVAVGGHVEVSDEAAMVLPRPEADTSALLGGEEHIERAVRSVDTFVTNYGVLGESLDLSGYSITGNGRVAPTDEIWFELGDTASEVIWPEDWIWLEGECPTLSPNTAYRIAVRYESAERIVANEAYCYKVPVRED